MATDSGAALSPQPNLVSNGNARCLPPMMSVEPNSVVKSPSEKNKGDARPNGSRNWKPISWRNRSWTDAGPSSTVRQTVCGRTVSRIS